MITAKLVKEAVLEAIAELLQELGSTSGKPSKPEAIHFHQEVNKALKLLREIEDSLRNKPRVEAGLKILQRLRESLRNLKTPCNKSTSPRVSIEKQNMSERGGRQFF